MQKLPTFYLKKALKMIFQIRKPQEYWGFGLLVSRIFSKVQKIIVVLPFQFSE